MRYNIKAKGFRLQGSIGETGVPYREEGKGAISGAPLLSLGAYYLVNELLQWLAVEFDFIPERPSQVCLMIG